MLTELLIEDNNIIAPYWVAIEGELTKRTINQFCNPYQCFRIHRIIVGNIWHISETIKRETNDLL